MYIYIHLCAKLENRNSAVPVRRAGQICSAGVTGGYDRDMYFYYISISTSIEIFIEIYVFTYISTYRITSERPKSISVVMECRRTCLSK